MFYEKYVCVTDAVVAVVAASAAEMWSNLFPSLSRPDAPQEKL